MNPEEIKLTNPTIPEATPTQHFHEGIGTPKVRMRDVRGGFFASTSDPVSAEVGQIYFNTSTGRFRGYDGTTWYNLGWTADVQLTGAPLAMASAYMYESKAYFLAYGGSSQDFGAAGDSTYYAFDVYVDVPNQKFRMRFNGGAWGDYIYPTIGFDQIDGVRLAGKGITRWDDFSDYYAQDFEGYTLGNIDKQDGWYGSDVFKVTTSNPNGGTQCVYSPGDYSADKIFTTPITNTGTITVECRGEEVTAAGEGSYAMILLYKP